MTRETHVIQTDIEEVLVFTEGPNWGALRHFDGAGCMTIHLNTADARKLAEVLIQSQMLQGHLPHLLACVQEELNRTGCGPGCAD